MLLTLIALPGHERLPSWLPGRRRSQQEVCGAVNKTISLVRPISGLWKPAASSPAERDLGNISGWLLQSQDIDLSLALPQRVGRLDLGCHKTMEALERESLTGSRGGGCGLERWLFNHTHTPPLLLTYSVRPYSERPCCKLRGVIVLAPSLSPSKFLIGS